MHFAKHRARNAAVSALTDGVLWSSEATHASDIGSSVVFTNITDDNQLNPCLVLHKLCVTSFVYLHTYLLTYLLLLQSICD